MNYEDFFVNTNLDFEYVPNTLCLTGVSFENRQNIIPNLQEGQNIYLKRNPENQYDFYAIKVLTKYNGELIQIGWIPKNIAKILSPEIDSGIKWSGKINKITGGNDKTYGIVIDIFFIV